MLFDFAMQPYHLARSLHTIRCPVFLTAISSALHPMYDFSLEFGGQVELVNVLKVPKCLINIIAHCIIFDIYIGLGDLYDSGFKRTEEVPTVKILRFAGVRGSTLQVIHLRIDD
eukprot:gene7035-7781_t